MRARALPLALALLIAAAPVVASAGARSKPENGPSVVDDVGRRVTLEAPAERIISLAPHLTELLYAAGAGERLVAAVSYSDYPPAARELPRVGSYDHLNIEAILWYQPDLVVAWKSGNPERQLQRLLDLGLTVYISEPRSLQAIADTLVRLGTLAGTRKQALAAANAFRERLAQLRARYADRPTVSVFYQIWNRPLQTLNGEHVISDVIRGCGGRNIFAELPAIAPRVSVEAVLKRDPEVIVASGMGRSRPNWLGMWRAWPELTAVARDNLFFVPPDIIQRHTPRILDGMARLCRQLQRARDKRPAKGSGM